MTVASNVNPISKSLGNDLTYQFSYDFRAQSSSDVLVTALMDVTDPDSVRHTLVAGVDYSLTLKSFPLTGGVVTLIGIGQDWMTNEFLKDGVTIVIQYNFSPSQSSKFRDWGPLAPTEIEKAFDRMATYFSSIKDSLSRTLKIQVEGTENVDTVMPSMVGQALKLVHINETEDGFGYDVTTAEIFLAETNAQNAAVQSAQSAENAALSAIASQASADASEVSRQASDAALAATLLAKQDAIDAINLNEASALLDIETARLAALVDVNASTAAAEAAASESEAARDLSEIYRDQALAAAASVTPKYQFLTLQTLNAGDKLAFNAIYPMQMVYVQGNGGDVTLNVLPVAAAPDSGALLTIMGTNDLAIVTILHNDVDYGFILKGDAYLGKGQSISVVYDPTLKRYYETERSM